MSSAQNKSLTAYRRRQTRKGIVRVELQVRKEDATLLRKVARALADPSRATETRALLHQRFGAPDGEALKALLAAAPLDGLDLSRERDLGRDIAL
ncbi:MAG: hypothetical protein HXX10_27020 [Rhodoplanes sp.]|uniref:hypothetical protein n=1 Tax=Rhodoplanes sp. TaxID=1968906 RepID=UPI00180C1C2E|nr:hypothetical protein [Rhodoplanes sp.]NVO17693.1 hypothetical protein [Rhodoplanes sp.]